MDQDMRERLKRAREYQRKAILELLPKGMEEHLEVIGNELKKMAEETIGRAIAECVTSLCPESPSEEKRVNKVEIE
ncbi:MAG: hypothetical protein J5546_08110 [Lachnospiraceae bacterium]|nr:hypothetical protein [Lachnospiraceae bacterium]